MVNFWKKIVVFQLAIMIIATTSAFGQVFGSLVSENQSSYDINNAKMDELANSIKNSMKDTELKQNNPEAYEQKNSLQEKGILKADGTYNFNNSSNASTTAMSGKSVLEFANENNLKINGTISVEEFLSDKGSVYCGSTSDKCNKYTHVCWRCSVVDDKIVGRKKYETGICLKGDYNSTAQTAYNECAKFRKQNANFFTGTAVWSYDTTRSPNGFLAVEESRLLWVFKTYDNESERTFVDKEGHRYILAYELGNPTLKYAGDSSAKGCEVLPIKIYNMSGCFFCPFAAMVFKTANDVTRLSFMSFGAAFQKLIIIVFAIWLAMSALQLVFTYTKQDGNKYLSSLIVQGGKFVFAYILLTNSDDLFRLFISPILETGLTMADKIKALPNVTPHHYMPSEISVSGYYNTSDLYSKIEYFLATIQSQLAAMQAIGSSLVCVGGHQMIDSLNIKENVANGLKMMFLGLILFIFALLLTISFAFYFLDALLQLAVLGAMMPFMIAGWPFKVTSSYSTTGLKMILNTFFVIFFVGFVISVNLYLIDSALSEMNRHNFDLSGNTSGSGLGGIYNAINSQNNDEILKQLDFGAGGFLILIFACIFGFKFVGQAPKLADKLAGGANLGVASRAATMGASAAKGAAQKVTKPVTGMIKDQYHASGGVAGMAGRLLQTPSRIASRLNNTKLGRAIAKTKLGTKVSAAKKAVADFGTSIKNKGEELSTNAQGKGMLSIPARMLGKIMQKFGNGVGSVSQKGLLGSVGGRIENLAKRAHADHVSAEKAAYDKNVWLSAHPDKTDADYYKATGRKKSKH